MKRHKLEAYLPPKLGFRTKLYLQTWQFVQAIFFNIPIQPLNTLRVNLLKLFGATLGKDVVIRPYVKIYSPKNLRVSDRVWIGEEVWIYNYDTTILLDDAVISQQAIICTASHDYKSKHFATQSEKIIVGKNSWVCIRGIVLMGSILSDGEIVPANSVRRKAHNELSVRHT